MFLKVCSNIRGASPTPSNYPRRILASYLREEPPPNVNGQELRCTPCLPLASRDDHEDFVKPRQRASLGWYRRFYPWQSLMFG